MRALAFAVVFAAWPIAPAAPVPKETKKPDVERILGIWTFDSHHNGDPLGPAGRWYFEADKLYTNGTDTTDQKGTPYGITLRPDKSPAEIDFESGADTLWVGIYKFEGGELHVVYTQGETRPKDFKPGKGRDVTILKRAPDARK